jgi:pimeloyl-ACP methyl ester carboxylesterase
MAWTSPTETKIYFETSGDPSSRPVILIEGLGAQMIGWRDAFVDLLVARDFFVIRLDNRDVGLSHMTGAPDVVDGGYALADMADDVFRVLDVLGLHSAHVVGQSMGGAVAQHMAMARPDRVASLVLFYTAPAFSADFVFTAASGDLAVQPAALDEGPDVTTREGLIASLLDRQRLSTPPGGQFDEVWARDLIVRSLDRSDRLDGIFRQMAAMTRAGDWRERLGTLTMPTAIIHGRGDLLVKVEAAFELARRIGDSEVHVYADLGHEIARPLWKDFAGIIDRTASRDSSVPAR